MLSHAFSHALNHPIKHSRNHTLNHPIKHALDHRLNFLCGDLFLHTDSQTHRATRRAALTFFEQSKSGVQLAYPLAVCPELQGSPPGSPLQGDQVRSGRATDTNNECWIVCLRSHPWLQHRLFLLCPKSLRHCKFPAAPRTELLMKECWKASWCAA